MAPPLGAIRVATMFRMVLLPQPEGPSRATNSPSLMRNETSSTATTSRPSAWNVLQRPAMSIRQDEDDASAGILGMRRLQELVGDGVFHLDRRLDAGELAVPDLLAAGVGLGRDQAVPVADLLQLADLQQVRVLRGGADELLDGAQDLVGRAL